MRPLIGITAYEVPASFSHWRDMRTVMIPAGYADAVEAAGGMPFVTPPLRGTTELLDRGDGLGFTEAHFLLGQRHFSPFASGALQRKRDDQEGLKRE